MNQRSGLSGCQIAGIALAALMIAAVCMTMGLVLGGGVGLITGGTAGYAIGRAQSTHVEIPIPQLPGDRGERPPQEAPGREIRPYLGVRYETVEEGARIMEVEADSPADQAGLREGDVILAVDGEPVGEGNPALAARVLEHNPWEEVELRVWRGDEELELEVTLGAQFALDGHPSLPPGEFPGLPDWPHPPEGWPPLPPEWEWPQQRPYLGVRVHQLEEGAKIVEVAPGSPAEEAGLHEGDIILAVDDEEVTQETPLASLIAAHEPGDVVVLIIERDGQERESKIELGKWPAPADPGATLEG